MITERRRDGCRATSGNERSPHLFMIGAGPPQRNPM